MGSSLLFSALNCRDLGGHHTASGAVTAFDRFWRSDVPRGLDPRDADILRFHGISRVIDLRTAEEAADRPSAFAAMPGIIYEHSPISEGSAPPTRAEDVPESYLRIAEADSMPALFQSLADAPGGVLFHCTAGKDRTGVLSAILLLHAGAEEREIIDDYVLSRENNRERLEAFLKAHPEVERNTVLAREESMAAFLRLFLERHGGTDGYFRFLGLTEKSGGSLRDKLLGQ